MSHTITTDNKQPAVDHANDEISIIEPHQEREILFRRTELRSLQKGFDAKANNLSSSTIVGRKRNRGCLSDSEERSSQRARTTLTSRHDIDDDKHTPNGPLFFDLLTDDLIVQIFLHLPQFPSLVRMREVSQRWNRLACNPRLWTWLSFQGHEHVNSINLNALCKSVSLKRLRKLSLAKVHSVDESCLRMIPRNDCAATLESVDLSWCSAASDRSVVEFSRCPGLKELRLSHCRLVSRRSVRILAVRCPRLEVLDMNCISGLRDSLLTFIGQNCPLLRVLNIANGKNISDSGLCSIARGCARLEELDISWCTHITDNAISKLASHLKHLRNVSLSYTAVTNFGVADLVRNCPALDTIELAGCSKITDTAITHIIDRCSERLVSINLSICLNVSDDAIIKLVSQCPRLRFVDVYKRACQSLSQFLTEASQQRQIEVFY